MKKTIKKLGIKKISLILLFWLIIWQIAAATVGNKLFLPGPIDSFWALIGLLKTKAYYMDVAATIFRTTVGIVTSFAMALVLSFVAYKYRILREILSLPVSLLKSIPVMAIIIYALILLSSDMVPIFVCFLLCFPICYINLLAGLDSLDGEIVEMAKVFDVSRKNYVGKILLPSLGYHIRASFDLVAGLSWKAVVSAEVLAIPDMGMGFNLINAKYYLETEALFAWVVSIVFFSYIYERILRALTASFEFRQYKKSKINLSTKVCEVAKPSGQPIVLDGICKSFGCEDDKAGKAGKARKAGSSSSCEGEKVLDGLSLTFEPNVRTSIVAPSGYGKTTLLRIIAGLEKADSGRVFCWGRLRISYLFQEDRLIPWLNIYDNLAICLADKLPEAEARKRIEKILKIMELDGDFDKLPSQLSGGMRHRAALARAFVFPADVLLLDEPFKGLDLALIDRIIDGAWVRTTKDKTVIFTSHIPEISRRLADKVIEL